MAVAASAAIDPLTLGWLFDLGYQRLVALNALATLEPPPRGVRRGCRSSRLAAREPAEPEGDEAQDPACERPAKQDLTWSEPARELISPAEGH
jgi:hypothetical protein